MTNTGPTLRERLGYGSADILVIAHVDDIGMHPDETAGALAALDFGMARTGSVMVPAPGFADFAGHWRKNPDMDIGVHVCLTSEWDAWRWPPVLPPARVPSLLDAEGFLWKRYDQVAAQVDAGQAAREMRAQVEKVLGMGLAPTHIDPHMLCFFTSPALLAAAADLAREHSLVIPFAPSDAARAYLQGRGLVCADTLSGFYSISGEDENPELRRAAYHSWLQGLSPGVHYLYLHPARVTPGLAGIIETPYVRSGDLDVWTSGETRALADERGIRFIGIRGLRDLQLSS